ncbi:MAG: ABC transporter ATP-binding protein, partial [Candidatus Methanoplasma sp.]|nr:ABC transporter ATP-binding protein [Candidatus Methanoplasma sp.]
MMNIRDLEFSYGSAKILDGVSFDAEDNEVISILGPNGTGKTTLLKCLCNIYHPDGGQVLVDGTNVLDLKGRELAKNIGFVPQSVPVSRMSVFDSVLMGRRPYIEWGATRSDIDKVSSILDALGMSHLSLRYMDQISGGEFQKAQIARAIVQEPKVLILDEPTNNLDISNQHTTMHMIEHAVRSRGMCTIMTMHDINLAVHYSDRFLFMKDGKVAAYGGIEIITEDLIKEVYGMRAEIV